MLNRKITFLYFFIFFLIFSCSKDSINSVELKSIDSDLDSIYKIALNKSLDRSKRLNELDSLLFYASQNENINYQYKALMLKTSLLSKFEINKAIFFSEVYKDIAIENKDTLNIGKALLKLGHYNRSINEIQKSFNYYNQAFMNFKLINDSVNSAKSLLKMSGIQKDFGDYNGSKAIAIDGLKFLEGIEESNTRVGLNQNITISLKEEGDFEKALEYNKEANKNYVSDYYSRVLKNTKANILAGQGNYNDAISILDSIGNKITNKNSLEVSRIKDNLGHIHWKKDSLNKISEKLLVDAQEIRLLKNDVKGLIASNMHLAEFYFKTKPNKSLYYAEEALVNATKINSMVSQLEALSYIINLKDNPKQEALSYTKIDKKLKNINSQNRELYAVNKYQNEELTKRNLKIEAENEKKQKLNSRYLFGLITVLLTSLLIFVILKSRHTKEKQKKVLETESRISKRIHDELANDVYSSMVQLENKTASIAEVVDNLEEIYHKARDLSQETTAIRSNKEFIDNLKKSLASFNNDETNVIVKGLIADIWIDISDEKKLIVHRVLKELLVNMRKHSSANLVSVIFTREINSIKIVYTDNGVGTYKKEVSKGVGLVNAENRIEAIGGSFIFDKSVKSGFKVTIEIPV